MLQDEIKNTIKDYPNFPKDGIIFKDILPIFENPKLFEKVINSISGNKMFKKTDAIIAIDARGFLLGSSIALKTSKPLILARKPGKLPGELITGEYQLEYGKNSLSIQKEALKKFSSYVIVDDLLATGGTVDCIARLINENGRNVLGLLTVVELESLDGRTRFDFPVESIIKM